MFHKILNKCLKVCGKAIHLPRLNDGRVGNREKNCVFLEKKCCFWTILCKILPQKAIPLCTNCFAL